MKLVQVAKSFGAVMVAPVRIRRHPDRPSTDASHYAIPTLADSAEAASVRAADIPVQSTPKGRWADWPPLVLAGCDEPLADGAPDLRGMWLTYKGPMKGHIERVEQAGSRVVITSAGIIHDLSVGLLMRDEGVGGADISVTPRFENGRINLYVGGKRLVVTRYADGDDMVWRWGPWTSRLRRMSGPADL
jgi:hypothetical protein